MLGEELERFASFVKTAKGQRHLHKIVEDGLTQRDACPYGDDTAASWVP
jgi:hypothetical protein